MQGFDAGELLRRARQAAAFSYSPYSHFPVGAALLCDDGSIVTGANVENRSFGLANCAERSALFTAVSGGKMRFVALAVVCLRAESPVSPCGACRQALSEFCAPEMPIVYQGRGGETVTTTMGQLLPNDALHDLKNGL